MKNKIVGLIIVGIALLVGTLTYLFEKTLTEIHAATCSMGPECAANQAIAFQHTIGIIFFALLVLVGLYMIFFGQERVEIIKRIRERVKSEPRKDYSKLKLPVEERKLINLIIQSEGAMFQSDLVEKSGFDKVKVSRLLDRLEGQQIIERKRRGMTNIVILK
jgi:uncharacterized membrane protein